MLDSVRIICVPKTIQSELHRPKSTRFSPSELESLQKKCRNLRCIRSLAQTETAVSPIKIWDLDISQQTIRTSEVLLVDYVEDLTLAYLERDMRKVWKRYTVTRSIKLLLYYGPSHDRSGRGKWTNLESSDDS